MSTEPEDATATDIGALTKKIHELRPLIAQDGEFIIDDVLDAYPDLERSSLRGSLRRARDMGAVRAVRRERTGGNSHWVYRWDAASQEYLRDYLADMATLPCGCRAHIPDTRRGPDGMVLCKYCDERYDRAQFMALVEDKL